MIWATLLRGLIVGLFIRRAWPPTISLQWEMRLSFLGMNYNEPSNLPIDDIFGFPSSELFHDEFPFDNNLEFGILDDLRSNIQTDMNFND